MLLEVEVWNTPEHAVFLNKVRPQEELIYQSLTR